MAPIPVMPPLAPIPVLSALAPIVLILVLMLGLRWPAARAGLAAAAVLAVWPAWSWHLDQSQTDLRTVSVPFQASWPAAPAAVAWQPEFPQSLPVIDRAYRAPEAGASGPAVGLKLMYFRNEHVEGHGHLISSVNRLTEHKSGWHVGGQGVAAVTLAGQPMQVRESRLFSERGERLLVWQWYWIDGQPVSRDVVGKLLQARQRLLHGRNDGAAVLLYAPYDDNPDAARAALASFVQAHDASLAQALNQAARP